MGLFKKKPEVLGLNQNVKSAIITSKSNYSPVELAIYTLLSNDSAEVARSKHGIPGSIHIPYARILETDGRGDVESKFREEVFDYLNKTNSEFLDDLAIARIKMAEDLISFLKTHKGKNNKFPEYSPFESYFNNLVSLGMGPFRRTIGPGEDEYSDLRDNRSKESWTSELNESEHLRNLFTSYALRILDNPEFVRANPSLIIGGSPLDYIRRRTNGKSDTMLFAAQGAGIKLVPNENEVDITHLLKHHECMLYIIDGQRRNITDTLNYKANVLGLKR